MKINANADLVYLYNIYTFATYNCNAYGVGSYNHDDTCTNDPGQQTGADTGSAQGDTTASTGGSPAQQTADSADSQVSSPDSQSSTGASPGSTSTVSPEGILTPSGQNIIFGVGLGLVLIIIGAVLIVRLQRKK